MGIALHPYIMGQPFRMRQLRRALAHIVGQRERIWVTTAGAIFDHVAGFLPGPSRAIRAEAPAGLPQGAGNPYPAPMPPIPPRHLLAIEGLEPPHIADMLDLAESYALLNRSGKTQRDLLKGRTLINLFFEDSTRTRTSFELAGKRLGADVINMAVSTSSVNKGETLLDTASTLNAMQCDLLVIRHAQSGAPALLSQKVEAAVINAGDGTHEHPTQALLDALTIRRHKGHLDNLVIAICGDVLHSRVARSNIHLLLTMGARVRIVGPPTLIPAEASRLGVEIFHTMREGLAGADVVMMLRLQKERMSGGMVPSSREFFRFFGLDAEKLAYAKPDAIVMHPGPMNRGVEIDSAVADDPVRSVIGEQVEMGVACRMAVLDLLSRNLRRNT
ncbi:MAG: pyrB [Rhodospirillales bacterium]|nr:pyrB [Rhodospirillales bacterium]